MEVSLRRGGQSYLIPRFPGLRMISADLIQRSDLSFAAPSTGDDVTDVGEPERFLPTVALAEGQPAIIHEPAVFLRAETADAESAQPAQPDRGMSLAPPALYLLVGTDADTLLLLAADHAEVCTDTINDADPMVQAQRLDLSELFPND
jgi:hypothetical protein